VREVNTQNSAYCPFDHICVPYVKKQVYLETSLFCIAGNTAQINKTSIIIVHVSTVCVCVCVCVCKYLIVTKIFNILPFFNDN
jgi:hypothetical protein